MPQVRQMASEGGEQNTRFAKSIISIGPKSMTRDKDRDRDMRWGENFCNGDDILLKQTLQTHPLSTTLR